MKEAGGLLDVAIGAGGFPATYAGEVSKVVGAEVEEITVDSVLEFGGDGVGATTVGGPAVATEALGDVGDED